MRGGFRAATMREWWIASFGTWGFRLDTRTWGVRGIAAAMGEDWNKRSGYAKIMA